MRSGIPGLDVASNLRGAGSDGYIWSASSASRNGNNDIMSTAYYIVFMPSWVSPSRGPNVRWFAISLRCLLDKKFKILTYLFQS